jgi:hypothetical protein
MYIYIYISMFMVPFLDIQKLCRVQHDPVIGVWGSAVPS